MDTLVIMAAGILLVGFVLGRWVQQWQHGQRHAEPLEAPPKQAAKSINEYVDGLFKPPSTPPGPLLPHQFRMTLGEDWEADLDAMTLSRVRVDGLTPLKEPVLYSLRAEPDGGLSCGWLTTPVRLPCRASSWH